ncbi:RES family NAD+ phosphorylase [Woodsholea maritima]|uniref:RES family NAD+ phosphorylase n=1 Tax=Woodsholea maritima TaxID=240237 RepID=UPI0014616860|nr:RES family NAD+ phosphorylase [Woodsholea maritima]
MPLVEKLCCAECFGDRHLREEIIPTLSECTGRCSFCKATNQQLVTPRSLGDQFGAVIGVYVPDDEGGRPLVEWLMGDWLIFKTASMSAEKAQILLAEILDDGEIVRRNFSPSEQCQTVNLDRWRDLKEELQHRNRFFPDSDFNKERLAELLDQLLLDSIYLPTQWFRARIVKDGRQFGADEMGAPPKMRAGQGRANPAGIPYLYLASSKKTAVAEVRPHPGETVCVGTFNTPDNLKIADLRNPRASISPFQFDDSDLPALRGDVEFLENLGAELTRPVVPTAAAINYIPSQYLCEFIKKQGFDGVAYASSIEAGMNLALFNPDISAEPDVETVIIESVSVRYRLYD